MSSEPTSQSLVGNTVAALEVADPAPADAAPVAPSAGVGFDATPVSVVKDHVGPYTQVRPVVFVAILQ